MTTPSDQASAIRPILHFTAPQAWLNDPHGICWVDDTYHLFYQHNPAGNVWSSAVEWGHATSPDLVRWRHQPVALRPHDGEEGCWTGATLVENGQPTIFYTSVPTGDWNRGRVAVALPDQHSRHWVSSADDVLIDGPPDGLGAHVFRDPCIFRTDQGWTMIVGVGITSGTGLVVQYTSSDARAWTYGGVVCSRPSDETDGVWTGTMWECPQLFRVGDDWALVVSVWDNDTLYYCAGAVGSYDGTTFKPERWSRLTYDQTAYAMTSFTDNAGRPGVMFWLREDADHDPASRPWAGALSLPMVADLTADRTLRLRPHPDVDTLQQVPPLLDQPLTGRIELDDATGLDLVLPAGADQRWELKLSDADGQLLHAALAPDADSVTITRAGRPAASVPVTADTVRVIIDAGIVEIFPGSGCASFRIRARERAALIIDGATAGRVVVHRLAPALN